MALQTMWNGRGLRVLVQGLARMLHFFFVAQRLRVAVWGKVQGEESEFGLRRAAILNVSGQTTRVEACAV